MEVFDQGNKELVVMMQSSDVMSYDDVKMTIDNSCVYDCSDCSDSSSCRNLC